VLHIGAALRHHLILRDDILTRMLPWGRQAETKETSSR
jgi:cytochrome b561